MRKTRITARYHADEMRRLYRNGASLNEIAKEYGVTSERVRQIIPDEPARRRALRKQEREEARERQRQARLAQQAWNQRHGTQRRYAMGCHCDACRAINTRRHYELRMIRHEKMVRGELNPVHGKSSTYANYICRCEPCSATYAAETRVRKQRWAKKQREQ